VSDIPPEVEIDLSGHQLERLERLARMRGTDYGQVLDEAIAHLLASLELGQPVHSAVPSEQGQDTDYTDPR
jgi:hypothetical protein